MPQDERPRQPLPQQSFRQTKTRRNPVPWIAGAVALVLAVCAITFVLKPDPAEVPASRTEDTAVSSGTGKKEAVASTSGAAKDVKLGVFRSTSPYAVQQFGAGIGRDVDYVVDFSRRGTWTDIANPVDHLAVWKGTDYRVVYGVAMLPEYRSSGATIAAGANGDYNQYYRTLAQNLVNYGQGDAILRLGWEFNLAKSTWHPDDRKEFIAYWRQIVRTMRAVPGAEGLEFDWNVNNGGDTYDATVYYPGNKYVDYIGVDIYDIAWEDGTYPYPAGCDTSCRRERQEKAWEVALNATYGLIFWSDFAERQGVPMSFPEWGLWERPDNQGGGDNPYFIEQMHDFIDNPQNNVAYQVYFDYDVSDKGDHRLASFPKAGKKYAKLFGND